MSFQGYLYLRKYTYRNYTKLRDWIATFLAFVHTKIALPYQTSRAEGPLKL